MVRIRTRKRRAGALALAFLVAAVAASPGTGSASEFEGEPGGPPACSFLPLVGPPIGFGVDVWIQCNYHVGDISVALDGRRIGFVPAAAELIGAAPGQAMACKRESRHRLGCSGGLGGVSAFTRIHARMRVKEGICRTHPRVRLELTASGGPECIGNCPGIGFRTRTPGPPSRSWMGCGGGGR